MSHRELPRHLADADALIIPYKINAFSKGTFPAKIFECLATGKPIVATPLPDLLPFGNLLYLAKDVRGFLDALGNLPDLETEARVEARVEFARKNSWEARFDAIREALLGQAEGRRESPKASELPLVGHLSWAWPFVAEVR